MRKIMAALVAGVIIMGAALAEAEECRLALTSKIQYAPQLLAFKNNWFEAKDMTFKMVDLGMSTGIAAAEALISGSADAAVMGDVPAIMSIASDFPCQLVCSYGGGEDMHSLIVSEKSGISTVDDLKGKKIGVHFGSSAHGGLQLFLKKHDLDKSATLVNTPQKNLIEALASGSVDAILASEPAPSLALEKIAGSKKLSTLSGLGNDYPLMLVVSKKFADKYPQAVAALVNGTRRAIDFIKNDPGEAAEQISAMTGTSAAIEKRGLESLEWKISMGRKTIDSLLQTAEFLEKQGRLKKIPDIRAAVYDAAAESPKEVK